MNLLACKEHLSRRWAWTQRCGHLSSQELQQRGLGRPLQVYYQMAGASKLPCKAMQRDRVKALLQQVLLPEPPALLQFPALECGTTWLLSAATAMLVATAPATVPLLCWNLVASCIDVFGGRHARTGRLSVVLVPSASPLVALLLLAAGLAAISLAARARAAAAAARAASAARALTPELLAAWRMTLVEAGEPDQARGVGPSTSERAADPVPAAPSDTAATPVLGGAMAAPGRLPQGPSEQGLSVASAPRSATHAALEEEVRELEQIIHGPGAGPGKEGGGGGAGAGRGRARSLEELARAVQRLAAEIGGEWLPADAATPRALLARTRALRAVVG